MLLSCELTPGCTHLCYNVRQTSRKCSLQYIAGWGLSLWQYIKMSSHSRQTPAGYLGFQALLCTTLSSSIADHCQQGWEQVFFQSVVWALSCKQNAFSSRPGMYLWDCLLGNSKGLIKINIYHIYSFLSHYCSQISAEKEITFSLMSWWDVLHVYINNCLLNQTYYFQKMLSDWLCLIISLGTKKILRICFLSFFLGRNCSYHCSFT